MMNAYPRSTRQQGVEQKLYPQQLVSISEIQDCYDLFLVDIVGVLGNGVDTFPEAIDCLNKLQRTKSVTLLSNMPRPGVSTLEKLRQQGLASSVDIFTSGDAIRLDLQDKLSTSTLYHLGADRNQDILKDISVSTTQNLDQADFVLLTQFIEENESLEQFDGVLKDIARRQLPTLCANPDLVALNGTNLRYTAGTFAQRLMDFGGCVQYYGKPNPTFYEKLMEFKPAVAKDRMLMIGDTLETDIQGALSFGIDSLLVLSGNTARDIHESGKSVISYLKDYESAHKVSPSFIMDLLKY